MHSLLEVKRQGQEWKTIIFPTDSLHLDHLDIDQAAIVIRLICNEMSNYMPGDIFMPHEVAINVIGSLDQDEYNDNEWEDIKHWNYELVIGFADIIFGAINEFSNIKLVDIDESAVKIQLQTSPKENY